MSDQNGQPGKVKARGGGMRTILIIYLATTQAKLQIISFIQRFSDPLSSW
ncbi:MAG TPA: hypothetical protein VMW20_08390 [Candidatus Nanoarchaeia archaeon]|nr:hypothetical protein [Candidatus Nanoarchaeia archaeon]